jgi:uncharacterized protein YpuA (DUF1002 family)
MNISAKNSINIKEKTKTVSYRLPEKLIAELEKESTQKEVSQNVLVKQILEKYVRWDRYSDKIGMIPVPKDIMQSLGTNLEGQDINMIIDVLKPIIKDNIMFMKGKYDLKRCIETLEDYMRASGMKSDHRIEGELHHFIIQHELGMSWSLFTEQLLKEIFHEFLPEKNMKTDTTESTVIATIALGSDFDEHDY